MSNKKNILDDLNLDKEKLYFSPSEQSIMAYVDGVWVRFTRNDVVEKIITETFQKFLNHE